MTLADRINLQLVALDLTPLNSEQVECLADPARLEEAAAMLDDLHARCGVRLPLPTGKDLGLVFADEMEAREAAEKEAHSFDAVCIEAMATDDSRSYGGNEYRVLTFSGADAGLAAACQPQLAAYWVAGEEH